MVEKINGVKNKNKNKIIDTNKTDINKKPVDKVNACQLFLRGIKKAKKQNNEQVFKDLHKVVPLIKNRTIGKQNKNHPIGRDKIFGEIFELHICGGNLVLVYCYHKELTNKEKDNKEQLSFLRLQDLASHKSVEGGYDFDKFKLPAKEIDDTDFTVKENFIKWYNNLTEDEQMAVDDIAYEKIIWDYNMCTKNELDEIKSYFEINRDYLLEHLYDGFKVN